MMEALRGLWLLLGPSRNRAARVYDLLSSHNRLGEESFYLNLGYWDGARTYDEAAQALARVLAEAARLRETDEVLDCGFGFADQDLFWAAAFSPKRIVGLNVTGSQVQTARGRVARQGLAGRIQLLEGSATSMPFGSACFDKVLALETAFHFDTRETFFREAFRVLRPGGQLATADILPREGARAPRAGDRLGEFFSRSFWQIPAANVYPEGVYREKLRAAGFERIEVRSIAEKVRPIAEFARRRLEDEDMAARMSPWMRALWKASLWSLWGFDRMDYVIVTARKP